MGVIHRLFLPFVSQISPLKYVCGKRNWASYITVITFYCRPTPHVITPSGLSCPTSSTLRSAQLCKASRQEHSLVMSVFPQWPHTRALCLCVNSRSQMRDSSPFAGVVTICSLCVCRAVPTSQTPSCTPWDRIVLDSGKLMNILSRYLSVNWLRRLKKCLALLSEY